MNPTSLDAIYARIKEILAHLNSGGAIADVPDIAWEATREYEGGGEDVLVVLDCYVLRRGTTRWYYPNETT